MPSLIPSTYHGILRFAKDISWAVLFVFFGLCVCLRSVVCSFHLCYIIIINYIYIYNYNQMISNGCLTHPILLQVQRIWRDERGVALLIAIFGFVGF